MKRLFLEAVSRHFRFLLIAVFVALVLLTIAPDVLLSGSKLPVAKAASQNPIQVENSLPGDPTWNDFSSSLTQDAISGYGSKISVNHGDSLDLYVTTTAPSFTIDIYRTGWYNGAGARKITTLGTFTGIHQAIPKPDPVTGIVACNWTKATTLSIPTSWVTGVYLARLNASNGNKSFIFFVVRNDGGNEDVLFQASVTTYQAYNTWGGTSLYNNNTDKSIFKGPHATKVSFDRPFNPGDSNGAGHYFFYEFKFVYWMESQGYNVAYTTNVDTDTNASTLTNHKAFLSVGHDEYWSKGMRDTVQQAINAGVNVAFFSANAMYWQIRFESNAAGVSRRVEVGYKDFATDTTPPGPDPMWNVNNSIVTTNWRADPVNEPENGVIGVMFEDEVGQSYPFVVQNASSWVYAGTGFQNGSSVPGIVGYEYDKVFNNGASPAGLTILGNSPVVGDAAGNSFSNATLYTASSGARVFAAGTIQWSWGLANVQSNTYANAGIQRATANILNNFIGSQGSQGPAVTLNPTSISFGNQATGTTSAFQAVTVSNSGTSALSISSIAISGTNSSDFAQTNNCPSSLAANATCTINVTFIPGAAGARSGNLTITDNANGSPQTVTLSGTGTTQAPAATLNPTSINFGNQAVNVKSSSQTITLTSSGGSALSISSIALSGTNSSDFAQTNNCPSSLAANASCTINVTFTPGATGARNGSLTVTDNASGSPQTVPLSGTGTTSTTYFNDGFESGNLSAWTLPSGDSTGSATVQNTVVDSGSSALSLHNASGQYAYVYTALPAGPQAQTFTRFYFRYASSMANGTQLAIARNANGGNVFEVDLNLNRHGLDIYFWNGANTIFSVFSPSNVLSANTWYSLEIQDTQATSGHGEVWLNGSSVGAVNGDLSMSNPYARLMLYDSAAGTLYLDDVKVSSAYNGTL
jgi:Abnormal spindle-like microcephaly-assoc'd, ASPM-SPD-2-Hydin